MACVIKHPEWGIYLGGFLGLGFWSKLDPVGQPGAVTFPDEQEAKAHMETWDGGPPAGVSFPVVVPDDGQYVSIAGCVAAGLEGWLDEVTPTGNKLPA